jgi:hypothetical protein
MYRAARHTRRAGFAHLLERDLRLGLELDFLGNMRLLAEGCVLRPCLRQIQPIGDGQAGIVCDGLSPGGA